MKSFHSIPNTEVIDNSGNKYWISPSISVDALVIVAGQVLVTRRSDAPEVSNPLKWCLPCGFMEWNETPLNACMRELCEETGIDIRELKLLNNECTTDSYKRPHSENGTALQFVFMLSDFPEVKLNADECVAWAWVSVDELQKYEWAFGHDRLIREFL
jgi:ADP-ribose pyrophosphatase YjhB (NUDIX family)